MATTRSNLEDEIKLWLKPALKRLKLSDFSVKIVGNSTKGDGYLGDIVFVTLTGLDEDSLPMEYDCVLKCSKKSKALRETMPVEDVFHNEIYFYETIFPAFTEFQKNRGVDNGFNSVAKCFGSFIGEDMEMLVIENLKKKGYELWPKKIPLTRKHIEMVVKEFGKLHATSAAMEKLQPEKFQTFVTKLKEVQYAKNEEIEIFFGVPIEQSCELLKNDLDENTLLQWRNFKNQLSYVYVDLPKNITGLKVILHGDCWNNNFMFLHEESEEKIPRKVAFLDWQLTTYSSPILDLSYFLFCCISEDDMENFNEILSTYHDSFINQLGELGVNNPNAVYPIDQFMNEWKLYSRFGIMYANLLIKVCSMDSDEAIDIAHAAENGNNFSQNFVAEIRDTDTYRKRIRPIVKHAVKHNLI